jgi:hypothetical protein
MSKGVNKIWNINTFYRQYNAIDYIVILWEVAIYGISDVGINVEISFITDKKPTKDNIEKIEKLLESSKAEKSLSSYYTNVKFTRAEVFLGEE